MLTINKSYLNAAHSGQNITYNVNLQYLFSFCLSLSLPLHS